MDYPFFFFEKESAMNKLNFYTVDTDYVKYLQQAELQYRGFCRVPNVEYGLQQKAKFLCGIVLKVNNVDYYVPVSSYRQQKADNFLIKASNNKIVGSLRFNYMFPIPPDLITIRQISTEPDRAYRALLSQELRYCITNQEKISQLAERTYKRVLLGKNKGLVVNSFDFQLLEQKCLEYIQARGRPDAVQDHSKISKEIHEKPSVRQMLKQINVERQDKPAISPPLKDRDSR